jgi:hypothetical protein
LLLVPQTVACTRRRRLGGVHLVECSKLQRPPESAWPAAGGLSCLDLGGCSSLWQLPESVQCQFGLLAALSSQPGPIRLLTACSSWRELTVLKTAYPLDRPGSCACAHAASHP